MDRVNEYKFYELGQRLSGLHNLNPQSDVGDYAYLFVMAKWQLGTLLEDSIGLRISRKTVTVLRDLLNSLVSEQFGGSHEGHKEPVAHYATSIKNALAELEAVLKAELDSLATYAVSQKGAYSTPDMIEHAESMVPERTRKLLPEGVIREVREAGRCLAFDSPTASGFHMLRGVELVMYELWKHVKSSGDKKPQNWGGYIEKFEKTGVERKVISMLRDIKDLYRNPNAHPQDTLEEEDATTLFALGVAAIQQMVRQFPGSTTANAEIAGF